MKILMKGVYLIGLFLFCLFALSCNKEKVINETPPANPYDQVDYTSNVITEPEPDPNTIVGIHKNIFSVKCANPGCHDGNFEPDFRTVMSAYNTLVYHKVIKNTQDSAFTYRVVPYNAANSWIHERLTTENATLGRMPLYSNPLSSSEMSQITTWINSGAKDMFGNPAVMPDTRPSVISYFATDSVYQRIDTIRVGGVYYNPFIVPQNSQVIFIFVVEDDQTLVENMQVNQMKISDSKNNFSAATTFQATYLFSPPSLKLWVVTLNTSAFSPGSTHYLRYYVNDGNHSSNTEFPTNDHVDAYKTYFSFYVQ